MIRRATTLRGREQAGLFSIEGTRLIERALSAGAPLETVLVGRSFGGRTDSRVVELLDELSNRDAKTVVAPDNVMVELTDGRDLGAILGLVRLPQPVSLETTLRETAPDRALFLAGVDILDPGNAGALVRTAHAAGATGFLAVGSTDPFHPRATRISRGSIFRLPVIPSCVGRSLASHVASVEYPKHRHRCDGGVPLPHLAPALNQRPFSWATKVKAVPDAVQQAVDIVVTIPMPTDVDSFAVNAAAAIVLYEFQRAVWSEAR